jgi:2'-hydroxyisoflavone reductase
LKTTSLLPSAKPMLGRSTHQHNRNVRILVLGGSVFLGRALVVDALRRGYDVTTFNRGITGADVPGVEAIRGDREMTADLERLVDGRQWDAVVDVCGFTPRIVGESARLLSGHADGYLFVSSISAVRDWPVEAVDESSPLHECPPDAGPDHGDYGVLKAGCERAVVAEFDRRVLIISPGLILGPHENVGRLPWWLRRIARGGQVLAPGDPDHEMQVIDARDIAAFGLAQISAGGSGRFLTSGVRGNTTFGRLLSDCVSVTGSDAELVWVDDEFLVEHGVEEWTELPVWTTCGPQTAAVWLPSSEKALAAGLRCRPVTETVQDTWDWVASRGVDVLKVYRETPQHGIDPAKEEGILTAWAARPGRPG